MYGNEDHNNEVLVGDLNLEPGNTLLYIFDFRELWKFRLVVEAIDPPDGKAQTPKVTARHGEAPEQYA